MIEMRLSYSGIREKGEGVWKDLGEGCTQAGKKSGQCIGTCMSR